MKFTFVKKFEKKNEDALHPGDIVEFIVGRHAGEVCLIIYTGLVSLQDPTHTWDDLDHMKKNLKKVPKGSVVTLTQE